MGLILLVTIVGIVASIIVSIANGEFCDFISGIMLTIVGIAIMVVTVGVISDCMPESAMNIDLTSIQPIIALKDGKGMTGRFFLYSGYVKENLYYYYACETEKGYKVEKVSAENSYIVYTEETPRIEKYEAQSFKEPSSWIYAIPLYKYNVLYVPDGTITTEYNINLE